MLRIMASALQPEPNWEYFETGSEPEFFVTHTKIESAGGGNLRIFCYVERHKGQLHLLYTAIVPPKALAMMARTSMSAAAEAHNQAMFSGASEH